MKICEIYERTGRMFIQASSKTEQGVWILDGEAVEVPPDSSDAALGLLVLAALGRSSAVPHPTVWGDVTAALLAKAGVKSWKTFAKAARNVSVELDGEGTVRPTRNLGPVDGFEPIRGQEITVPSGAPAARWGRSVREALAASLL